MAKQYKGQIRVVGRTYECEVINGVRYIDGKTVEEFYQSLDPITRMKFALLGATAIDCEKQGVDIPMQKTLDALDGQSAMS